MTNLVETPVNEADPVVEQAEVKTIAKKPSPEAVKKYLNQLRQVAGRRKNERRAELREVMEKQESGGDLVLSEAAAKARKEIIRKYDIEAQRINIQIRRCENLLKEAGE